MSDAEKLGAYLKICRTRAGWTQGELARHLELTQSKVSAMEYGNRWNVDDLPRAANVFGLTPGQFLDQALGTETSPQHLDPYEERLLSALRNNGRRGAVLYLVDNP